MMRSVRILSFQRFTAGNFVLKYPQPSNIHSNENFEKRDLLSHTAFVHEGKRPKKPYQCLICDAMFSRKDHLNGHVSAVHEGKKPYKCSYCEYRGSQKPHLKAHIKSNHKEKN